MWKTLASLAPFTIALAVTAVQPPEKPAEKQPAEIPAAKSPAKAGGKTDQKAAEKGASEPQFGVVSPSEKLLDEAIAKIESLTQYRSDMRQVVEMLGYKFVADGQTAVGPDMRMLFELKSQPTDAATNGTIKEVCDGKVLWKYQQIIDTPTLAKIDVQKIKKLIDDPKFKAEVRTDVIKRLGFNGVVPIMRGLRQSQKFSSHEVETLGAESVYVLQGTWQESAINQSTARGGQLSVANLPAHIPDKSTVWIGQQDGWPYKIRLESTKKSKAPPTIITIEFSNPMFNVALPENLFTFEPPSGLKSEDQTEPLYQGLSRMMQGGQDRLRAVGPIGIGPGGGVGPGGNPGQPKGKRASPDAGGADGATKPDAEKK